MPASHPRWLAVFALAVPATQITSRLRDALDGELDDDARAVISALVGAP